MVELYRACLSLLKLSLVSFYLFTSHAISADPLSELTEEERQWLQNKEIINVALLENNYPYMFKNEQGEVDGIVSDFIRELAEISGTEIEYIRAESWQQAMSMLDDGNVDLFPVSFHNSEDESTYRYSYQYLPYQKQLITQSDSPLVRNSTQFNDLILGIVAGSETESWIFEQYPNVQTKTYSSKSEALYAIEKGEVFGIISEMVSTMALANELGVKGLKANGMIQDWYTSFGRFTMLERNSTLQSIINKALRELSYESQNFILSKWLKDNPYRIKVNGAFDFGNPPYMYADSATVGLEYSFLQEVFNNMGLQIGDSHRASISTRKDILNSDADIDFNSGITIKHSGEHHYSDPILDIEFIAVSLKARNLDLSTSTLSKPLKLGAVVHDGESPSRKAFESFQEEVSVETTVDFDSLTEAFLALNEQTVDVLVVEKRVFDWFLAHESKLNSNAIKVHTQFSSSFPIYLEFRDKKLRDRFNASLRSTLANKPAVRQTFKNHIETDLRPQLERAEIIAQVMAMYLYKDDLEGLTSIVKIFDVSQDIVALEVFGNKQERKIYSAVNLGEGLVADESFNSSTYTRVTKDSVYTTENGDVKVGVVTFYFDFTHKGMNYAYLPSLEFFSHLDDSERAYIESIYETYQLTGQILNLTPSELDWIKDNSVQKLAVDPNALPYEAFNLEDQYIGIIAEFVDIINTKTGLSIEPVLVDSWKETKTLIESEQVTLISAAVENDTFSRTFKSSRALVSSPIAIASKADTSGLLLVDLSGWKVGILEGGSNTQVLMRSYTNIDWIEIDNTTEGLELVDSGDIDAVLDTVHVLNYLINSGGYHELRIVGRSDYSVSPTFHVSQDAPILQSIIDKAIRSIGPEDKKEVISKWSAPKYIDNTNYQLIYMVVGFSVLFIVISFVWNRRLQTQVERTKKAQAEAVHLQEQMFGVLKASPIAAAIIQDDKVAYCNERALELFKLEQNKVGDVNVEDIYSDQTARGEIYEELAQNKSIINKELTLQNMNEETFTALTSYYLIKHEGHPATLFWAYDISELKALNIQLEDAMVRADSANQAKSDFLANMSHEIRTPMNAILGMSYLALQEQQSKQAQSYVKKVHRSAGFLLSIINDILDFSKIEAGKLDIENAPFQLSSVIDTLTDITTSSAKDKPLEIELQVDHDVPDHLLGDSVRLLQTLLNLLGNAIKFTPKGRVSLFVQSVSRGTKHVCLHFEVKDTGIGIGEKQQQALFEAFSQADASITRKYGGTGLGLNISQQLVKAMGGEVSVQSEVGQGSCFSFELSFELGKKPETVETLVKNDLSETNNLHVLLVEDNELNQELAMAFLEKLGVEVDLAVNGEQAVEQVRSNQYDAVLMDIQMPVLDGYNATKQIREFDKETTIVAMSANRADDVKDKTRQSGMNGFVEKPIAIDALAKVLGLQYHGSETGLDIDTDTENDINEQACFDLLRAKEHCNQDDALLEKLVNRFLAQIEEIVPTYNKVTDNNELERYSHTLKSNCGAIGAMKASQVFSVLEKNYSENDSTSAREDLERLSRVLDELKQELEQYIKGRPLKETSVAETRADTRGALPQPIPEDEIHTLIALLESYDIDARAAVENLIERYPDSKETLADVEQQLEEYDFELALQTVNLWITK
ncbi:transporter substrate-binding domain-containing protein [uncultured Vibrio sp.]|uniref:ATP-binding protein n=1 Tax=uncultured Vibrio sp. TaxID=114054 RepID=UPI0025DB1941|nr:transporter substrate-binding domain-containing protein [uncultured Vibrio sp.]